MRRKRKSRIAWIIVAIIFVLAILVWAAQAWLTSEIGRGVVERRLSAAMGRPVRLDGEFEIRVLPLPGAAGTSMKVLTKDGRWLVLDTGAYLAQLSLWPLFRGEVEIRAVALDAASMDLDRLGSEPASGADPGDSYFQLPSISRFELTDSSIFLDGMGSEPFIRISSLVLDDFRPDASVDFEAEIGMVSRAGAEFSTAPSGRLILRSKGVVEVDFDRLDLNVAGWDIRGIEGGVQADLSASKLVIELNWAAQDQPLRLAATAEWDRHFETSTGIVVGGYTLEDLELVVGVNHVSGNGCAFGSDPLRLSLALTSESLDLDTLSTLTGSLQEESHRPGANATGRGEPGATGAGFGEQLPFEPAISLDVGQATFEGALAEGVSFRMGQAPDCREVR
jgi:hypothetical protein